MTREEQIQELAKGNYPEDAILRNAFILGAHLADATMLNKACKWLSDNLWIYLDDMLKPRDGYEKLENAFRKVMEE